MSLTYHMLDYIHEGPKSLNLTLEANEDPIREIAELVKKGSFERIILTGIGSSYTASIMSAPLFSCYSPVPIQVVESSEYRNLPKHLIDRKTMLVATSRSGERGYVTNFLKEAANSGAYSVAITGVADSLMTQPAKSVILTREGPEITFPKTKSVLVCTGTLMRLALALAHEDDPSASRRLLQLRGMTEGLERTFDDIESEIQELIPTFKERGLIAITGSGSIYGVALEGAMKVQEASYIPCYGYSTNAFLNGPIGAMNNEWLVISLITGKDEDLSRKVLKISKSWGAHTLSIIEPGLNIAAESDHCLTLPIHVDDLLAPLVYLPPMQLLAYFLTVARGMNPDAPTSMNSILEAILAPGREEPEFRMGLVRTS